ncbi:hypothetical protein HCH52_05440 [Oscillospiraceae bacterium HV4-5-C5C]|nr:hypothetical protein [Oscillospiraceae bacterium HV4-5-C5C]
MEQDYLPQALAAQFQNPPADKRGAPFWAWNAGLEPEELKHQIRIFKQMGFGGFHMHVRTGLTTPYLSAEFMDRIRDCVDEAKTDGLLAYLYDEDRWPSGAAGGLVTKNPAFRSRHLLLTRHAYADRDRSAEASADSSARAGRCENGELLAVYDVQLTPGGQLAEVRRLKQPDAVVRGFRLYAYSETALPSTWYNNQTYLDTLNPRAVRAFIDATHERYFETVGAEFGRTIPAIFTDEPQFTRKQTLRYPQDQRDVTLPWTADLPETYRQAYAGEDILDHLPELLWDKPDGEVSVARYHYHDHVAERFAGAFADQIGAWCQAHQLRLTGHMMEEPTLESQTAALGEAMRSYRSFQLPGIDMLCDFREFTTAKQAQSAARQFGRPGVLSELYGVTNWNFDFRGYKLQGDWQAALGVTLRVPHLSWLSMAGEAKRDYPATFNYQAPWYETFHYLEDHYARVNVAMTRGQAVVRLAVIHPVESYWLHWSDNSSSAGQRAQLDANFRNLTDWLLRAQLDFDFIAESLLPQLCPLEAIQPPVTDSQDQGPYLPVGQMRYQTILVPSVQTLRGSTLDRLERFRRAGGRVIFSGRIPDLEDAIPSQRGQALAAGCECIPLQKESLLQALTPERELSIYDEQGILTDRLLYQLRAEADGTRWLFLAQAGLPEQEDVPRGERYRIELNGCYAVTLYDTLSGKTAPLSVGYANAKTILEQTLFEQDSLLLRLDPETKPVAVPAEQTGAADRDRSRSQGLAAVRTRLTLAAGQPVPVTLEEPNVLLLDQAEYALDSQAWRSREEILRLDNILRAELNWPRGGGAVAQPWSLPPQPASHTLRLRYTFASELEIRDCQLALEGAAQAQVTLNGQAVPAAAATGWYVDRCIRTLALPAVQAGCNVLELQLPYGPASRPEAIYLLGDFGVNIKGTGASLTGPVRQLYFGDICTQGLPFYGGNLTYHLTLPERIAADAVVECSYYRGELLELSLAGRSLGPLAFSPYQKALGRLDGQAKRLDIRFFGCRVNTFGQLHLTEHDHYHWWGPESWRSTGTEWTYGYHLWPQGLLKAPDLLLEPSCRQPD